jgi:hypothetical protein
MSPSTKLMFYDPNVEDKVSISERRRGLGDGHIWFRSFFERRPRAYFTAPPPQYSGLCKKAGLARTVPWKKLFLYRIGVKLSSIYSPGDTLLCRVFQGSVVEWKVKQFFLP